MEQIPNGACAMDERHCEIVVVFKGSLVAVVIVSDTEATGELCVSVSCVAWKRRSVKNKGISRGLDFSL